MFRQQALFEMALKEKGISINNLSVDHIQGKCFNDGKEYPIIFPKSFIDRIAKIDKKKVYDYCFIGSYDDINRSWIKKYEKMNSFIQITSKGQLMEKGGFDEFYYEMMCHSRFILCPFGGCNGWTYRFLESCITLSIPVVEKWHEWFDDFHFYYDIPNDKHVYNENMIEENYKKFIKENTFI